MAFFFGQQTTGPQRDSDLKRPSCQRVCCTVHHNSTFSNAQLLLFPIVPCNHNWFLAVAIAANLIAPSLLPSQKKNLKNLFFRLSHFQKLKNLEDKETKTISNYLSFQFQDCVIYLAT